MASNSNDGYLDHLARSVVEFVVGVLWWLFLLAVLALILGWDRLGVIDESWPDSDPEDPGYAWRDDDRVGW